MSPPPLRFSPPWPAPSGRASCTLYPGEGGFSCMVTAGERAELLVEADSQAAPEDVKLLISLK